MTKEEITKVFNKLGIHITHVGKSYWYDNAAYSKEYEDLWNNLVPDIGSAETLHGELVRAFAKLNYDYFNNGNCNAIEEDEDEESEYQVSGFYARFIDLIEDTLKDKISPECVSAVCNNVRKIISRAYRSKNYFNNNNMGQYNLMGDMVMWYVLNTEDKGLPDWYLTDELPD